MERQNSWMVCLGMEQLLCHACMHKIMLLPLQHVLKWRTLNMLLAQWWEHLSAQLCSTLWFYLCQFVHWSIGIRNTGNVDLVKFIYMILYMYIRPVYIMQKLVSSLSPRLPPLTTGSLGDTTSQEAMWDDSFTVKVSIIVQLYPYVFHIMPG